MSLSALREGLHLVAAHPVLWLSGVGAGLLGAAYLALTFFAGVFIGSRVAILFVLALPFLVAGTFSQVFRSSYDVSAYLRGGKEGYFRVLLPAILIVCTALVTVALVLIPLGMLGIPVDPMMISSVFMGVLLPFAFFTFFFDAAAVGEGQKVFESIRRSTGLVIVHGWRTFAYYLENILLVGVVSFLGLIAWTTILYDPLEPIAAMNLTDTGKPLTFEQMQAILGPDGIVVSCVVLFFVILALVPVLLAWKACYFRELTGITPKAPVQPTGEYDEKGRWYKY
jgi:hypothetical protein